MTALAQSLSCTGLDEIYLEWNCHFELSCILNFISSFISSFISLFVPKKNREKEIGKGGQGRKVEGIVTGGGGSPNHLNIAVRRTLARDETGKCENRKLFLITFINIDWTTFESARCFKVSAADRFYKR